MRKVLAVCVFAGAMTTGLAGCGRSSQPSSAVEGATESQIEEYERLIAEDENLMTEEDLEEPTEQAAETPEG